ncbi:YncE family protein [Actinoplanes sp. N902-109]|uniref:YncE family protein n=1 Tax=Actinoplanes sp. (strain N902-109) TaxID=649831 RepID=UPI000329477E|nr:YncE family protein [Actinoplanes sp. N902-109]AGL18060.1 putative surface layer protein [Actinoplanes sp. N902-109]
MSDYDLPSQVLTEIASPARESRLTVVDELARLAAGDDLAMAAAARQALLRLAEDDSRSVSTAAVAALERTAIRLNPDRVDFGQVAPGTTPLVADILVGGPPLAAVSPVVTVSGPGVRAMMVGRRLRVVWAPESDWLDGSVTVRGPAGWADVRITGQIAAAEPDPAQYAHLPPDRLTVITDPEPAAPPQPRRRSARATALVAGLVVFVLLGGAGVGYAMTRSDNEPPGTAAAVPAHSHQGSTEEEPPLVAQAPIPAPVERVPLARSVKSVGRPTVVATVEAGTEPEGVAVAPDSRTVYIANQNSHVLSVLDARSRKVSQVQLRSTPRFVAVSGDGRTVFVSMYEKDLSGSGVAVVDAKRRTVERYLTTGVQPYALAVGPDNRLWVPIHSKRSVELYAVGDQRPEGAIGTPPNPHAVSFSVTHLRAFTPNHESNAVGVIDMRTDKVVGTVPVSKAPHSIAVSPDGNVVLVAGYDAGTADLIDARTLRRTGPFAVGDKPQSVAFAADGAHAYVVNEGDGTVSVLDGRTGAVTATVRVGRSPRSVAVSPDGSLAYVSNGDDNTVSVLRVGE